VATAERLVSDREADSADRSNRQTRSRTPIEAMSSAQADSPNDVEQMTAAVGRGDTEAFERLYRAWFDRVFLMTRGATRRDESFCLDVTQEAMLRAARRLPRLRSEAELAAWLGRTALSAAVDMLRRESRRRRRENSVARAQGAESALTDLSDEVRWLKRAFTKLPPVEQALLLQRVGNGCSLRQAGLAVGIGEQAAHGRLRRAMEVLRRLAREVLT
jgi:RNA polymerase sigma factor (sigma-70 family)